jgi:hypothetical protein
MTPGYFVLRDGFRLWSTRSFRLSGRSWSISPLYLQYIYIPCIIMCNMYIYISILFIVSIISPWYSWYPQVLYSFFYLFPPSTCRSFSTNQTTRDSLILSRPGAEERPTRGMAMHLQGQMCTKRQEFSSLTWVKDHRCPFFPLVVWWKKRSFFRFTPEKQQLCLMIDGMITSSRPLCYGH